MNRKKLLIVVAAATTLVLGGGAAVATQQLEEEEEAPIDKGATPAENGQQDETASETPAKLVKVDRAAAEAAALDAVPGEVRETELENEGGFVVYEVEIVDGAPRTARSPRRTAGGSARSSWTPATARSWARRSKKMKARRRTPSRR